MKKGRDRLYPLETAALLTLCAVLLSGVWAGGRQTALADRVVHVLAASDSALDQALKLAVRDAVLEYLTPRLEGAADAEEARAVLAAELPALERLSSAAKDASRVRNSSEVMLPVSMFSFSKRMPTPRLFRVRTRWRQSVVFLLKRLMDFVRMRWIFPSRQWVSSSISAGLVSARVAETPCSA